MKPVFEDSDVYKDSAKNDLYFGLVCVVGKHIDILADSYGVVDQKRRAWREQARAPPGEGPLCVGKKADFGDLVDELRGAQLAYDVRGDGRVGRLMQRLSDEYRRMEFALEESHRAPYCPIYPSFVYHDEVGRAVGVLIAEPMLRRGLIDFFHVDWIIDQMTEESKAILGKYCKESRIGVIGDLAEVLDDELYDALYDLSPSKAAGSRSLTRPGEVAWEEFCALGERYYLARKFY